MITYNSSCETQVPEAPGIVDVTDEIEAALAGSGVRNGRVFVFAPDDTCSVLVNERESGLFFDLKRVIQRLSPGNERGRALVGSSSVVVPVADGKLQLGTWQRVLFAELSRPGTRSISIQIVGER